MKIIYPLCLQAVQRTKKKKKRFGLVLLKLTLGITMALQK